jgi:flagellar protein FlgJ
MLNNISKKESDVELRKKQLREVSYDIEAIFIKMLLDEMRASVWKSELFRGGYAEEIWEDMLYKEYAKIMARTGKFGIADMIYRHMEMYV